MISFASALLGVTLLLVQFYITFFGVRSFISTSGESVLLDVIVLHFNDSIFSVYIVPSIFNDH